MNPHLQRNIYIWQKPAWPNFTWDDDAIMEPLGRLSYLNGRLNGRMSMLGFNDRSQSLLTAMTDELLGSSIIEGVQLNADSVRSSIARRLGIEQQGMRAEDHYVEGLVDIMLDAVQHCREPLTAKRLFGWHAALFPTGHSGIYEITVADWRRGDDPMQVVSGAFGHEKVHYEAPPSTAVPAEMERFIDWCNNTVLPPFVMAAVAHLWFVTVHPFDDGNGRISRTLADMFLARLNPGAERYYSMSAEISRNKKEYYDILERTQHGSLDITPWLLWFFGCLEKAIEHASETVEATIRKATYWERFRQEPVNERQRKILNRLWDGFDGKLTSSKWAKICHCSQDTATRDINDLIARGMLCKSGEGGRSTNYILPQ